MHRNDAKCVSLAEIQIPELSVADARRVLQHRLEHGLQIAREAADDLQHLGGGRLLLQRLCKVLARLGELAGARFELFFQLRERIAPATNAAALPPAKISVDTLAARPADVRKFAEQAARFISRCPSYHTHRLRPSTFDQPTVAFCHMNMTLVD